MATSAFRYEKNARVILNSVPYTISVLPFNANTDKNIKQETQNSKFGGMKECRHAKCEKILIFLNAI